jgi:hypothetical protein
LSADRKPLPVPDIPSFRGPVTGINGSFCLICYEFDLYGHGFAKPLYG